MPPSLRPARAAVVRALTLLVAVTGAASARAQERPYFVTYDHHLGERGEFETAVSSTTGFPRAGGSTYTAPWLEIEYGVTNWWTSEVYLEGVGIAHDGSAYTGWRWENRVRPWGTDHRVIPVLYLEYEHLTEASRIQKEIVGSGGLSFEPLADLRAEAAHELEAKLILSTMAGGWNVAENVIFEKNLSKDEGVEFGYAVAVSHALHGGLDAPPCRLCRGAFALGVEAYGGAGSTLDFGFHDTSQYLAPVVSWQLYNHSAVKASVGFGLTDTSDHALLRVAYVFEFER